MGTRTMESDGLMKQGGLYNLTLDEVQHHLGDLGKPLSSMNIHDLIESVYTAETEAANQGMINNHNSQLASAMADLSKKTVDELWQDMKEDGDCVDEKKPTLGEMTLEDFLAKAGIVAEGSQEKTGSGLVTESVVLPQQNVNPQITQWMQYHVPPGHHPDQQVMSDVAYPEAQMTVSSDTQTPGRKRVASGDLMEKTVERRQKRMIKNRESAARSRARKQAYTHALENKVSRLEEENERLKREQEAEKALPCVPPPEPKYQLRRTTSTGF